MHIPLENKLEASRWAAEARGAAVALGITKTRSTRAEEAWVAEEKGGRTAYEYSFLGAFLQVHRRAPTPFGRGGEGGRRYF